MSQRDTDVCSVAEFARITGLSERTIRTYLSPSKWAPDGFPAPDGVLGGRPWWYRHTIRRYKALRAADTGSGDQTTRQASGEAPRFGSGPPAAGSGRVPGVRSDQPGQHSDNTAGDH